MRAKANYGAAWLLLLPAVLCVQACSTSGGDGGQDGGAPRVAGTGGAAAAAPGSGGASASDQRGSGGTAASGQSGGGGTAPSGQSGGGGSAASTGGTGGSAPLADAGMGPDATTPDEPVVCPSAVLPPGDSDGTVSVGGTPRNYKLHVPASYDGKTPVPLVTDWHPILFDAAFQKANSGYQQKSDEEGFIVVWPDGVDNAWNIGPCCTRSRDVDDVAFAREVVAAIERVACIDPKRVYAVGYSMGGGMSYKLGCDAADLFAAVGPAAFELLEEDELPCHPARPISVVMFNGTADPIVPYTGGASNPPNGLPVTIHFFGTEETFERWSALNGCTGTPATDGICRTYEQCKGGVEVTLCLTPAGGHDTGDPDVGWERLSKHTLP
jgi:polyhydroxybutyrate depolymerase